MYCGGVTPDERGGGRTRFGQVASARGSGGRTSIFDRAAVVKAVLFRDGHHQIGSTFQVFQPRKSAAARKALHARPAHVVAVCHHVVEDQQRPRAAHVPRSVKILHDGICVVVPVDGAPSQILGSSPVVHTAHTP